MFSVTDVVLLIFLLIYLAFGLRKGAIKGLVELFGFVISFSLAFIFYPHVSFLFTKWFSLSKSFAHALGFLIIFFTVEVLYYFFAWRLYPKISTDFLKSPYNKIGGLLPALINGVIVLAVILTLLVAFPTPARLKNEIFRSPVGNFLVKNTSFLERYFDQVFGGAIKDTLTFLTISPQSQEKIDLIFQVPTLEVDETSETEMLKLVNYERTKRELKPLKLDLRLREIGRAHSKDMWINKYFSHINPKGEDPFDRMRKAGIKFTAAGENLALAPDVELAHQGLMDSPRHRANILSPDFGRIGIGVIDGGIYGKMFTQNFTN